ncbi:MAG TPA: glutathione S-transferase C-terminal domain-containing protein, partial [Baekduia sp.]|nr:glutathione S-transferase C-terminal domain-containing protein [Baekduia sp.]
TVEVSRRNLLAAFDNVAAQVGPSGYLVGDSFSVADLTAASMLGLIVVPPEFEYVKVRPDERPAAFRRFRDSLKDHLGFRWVEEMYARHRGTSAAVRGACAQAPSPSRGREAARA